MQDGSSAYPPFRGERIPVRQARSSGGGPVAGQYRAGTIADESASCRLGETLPVPDGSWVSGVLSRRNGNWALEQAVVHAPRALDNLQDANTLARKRDTLKTRMTVLAGIREFFAARGFLHVETPCRVVCPAVEAHLVAFPSGSRYLATSPELHLKRLLAAGYERIFEIARVFRQEEAGRHHLPEFTMLEWYRAWGSLEMLMRDCEELVETLCRIADRTPPRIPFPRLSFREAFLRFAGIDPFAPPEASSPHALEERAFALGLDLPPGEDTDSVLQRVYVHTVEPALNSMGAVFLTDFPPSQAALARLKIDGGTTVAARFECYLDGIELANAFDELNDPREQRDRIRRDNRRRQESGLPPYPDDDRFLNALDAGMPPAVGIALGVERLLMWLLPLTHIHDTVAFVED